MSHEWLTGTGAEWNGSKWQWTFPSGATLGFGFIATSTDHFRYKGGQYQFVGFDELTSFPLELQYRFLFGRMRRIKGMPVPVRCRSTSNPGDIGHEWVKQRFIDCGYLSDRRFIPARLDDNPGLDKKSYREMLAQLDPVTRAQMEHGDWDVRPEGNMFKRAWFDVAQPPATFKRVVRAWDFAATEAGQGTDPDWTVGVKEGLAYDGTIWILDLQRTRSTPQAVESLVKQTAAIDGKGVSIRLEQEPGSAGKAMVSHYQNNVLNGYDCRGIPATGDKVTRANPFSAACEQRRVKIKAGAAWIPEFLDELCAFPEVGHDDQVDAAVQAFTGLHTFFTIGVIENASVGSV